MHTSTIDFTDVAVHYPGLNASGTIFTVSCCSKFLLAANGCLIYIYEINKTFSNSDGSITDNPGSLRPVASILCPRRVLACSMDTSSYRYAVAVLLDGRMGLVCEISPCNITVSSHCGNGLEQSEFIDTESSRSVITSLDRVSLNTSGSNTGRTQPSSEPPFVFPGTAAASPLPEARIPGDSSWQNVHSTESSRVLQKEEPGLGHSSIVRAHTLYPGSQIQPNTKLMPIETGPRSLYRNICSDDDLPRSVAICPQRSCVAFGCSAGIELHWVDALTGQDLNRWFPLTAPSDYLFFLPPRRSVDSAKKLRLISSAARPGERAAISERAFGGDLKHSPYWESLCWGAESIREDESGAQIPGTVSQSRYEVRSRELNGRMDCSDHYRAIPLSDGYHILFTDPSTGLLCLGSDTPVGGPTKLIRKIWFQGPAGDGSPVAYAGAFDLTFGVRIVAAFRSGSDHRIWLYSVPGDVFAANQGSSQNIVKESWLSSANNQKPSNLEWVNWWPHDGLKEWLNHFQDPVPGGLSRSVWPVKIKGQEIGTLSGLVDLAIDSSPVMTIWAFSNEGMAKAWQLDNGKFDGSVAERLVARDGTIRDLDGEGDIDMTDALPSSSFLSAHTFVPPPPARTDPPDVIMSDAPSSPSSPGPLSSPLSHQPESFDGTASFTISSATTFTTRSERQHHIHHSLRLMSYDAGSDILMDDLQDFGTDEVMLQYSIDEGALAQAGHLVYKTFHRSESCQFGHVQDFVEELTGIARMDIEIH